MLHVDAVMVVVVVARGCRARLFDAVVVVGARGCRLFCLVGAVVEMVVGARGCKAFEHTARPFR